MTVTLYSTPSCPYCVMAKNYLRQHSIAFTEYNVAADDRRAAEMVRKSGQQGVPVLDIGGRVLTGFRPADIQQALKR